MYKLLLMLPILLFLAINLPMPQFSTPIEASTPKMVAQQWDYKVIIDNNSDDLEVVATFPPGTPAEFNIARKAMPFISNVELAEGDSWRTLSLSDSIWSVPDCPTQGCQIRYRFMLKAAADLLHNTDYAIATTNLLISKPSIWLMHPAQPTKPHTVKLSVTTPAHLSFAIGLPPVDAPVDDSNTTQTYISNSSNLLCLPYAVLGKFRSYQIKIADRIINVAIEQDKLKLSDTTVLDWIARAAQAIVTYYGQVPIHHTLIAVSGIAGSDIHGTTIGGGGSSISISLGEDVEPEILKDSWVLTHELIHTSFPSLSNAHAWMEEGIATYVEPIARMRAGQLSPEAVWGDLVANLPMGLPHDGDGGLDDHSRWGRTYWGGALFCLLADINIHAKSNGKFGFENALRGILADGGNISNYWTIDDVLQTGDDLLQTGDDVLETEDKGMKSTVLGDLYDELSAKPVAIDLDEIWQKLGISVQDHKVSFNDDAPLADIRRAITGEGQEIIKPPYIIEPR